MLAREPTSFRQCVRLQFVVWRHSSLWLVVASECMIETKLAALHYYGLGDPHDIMHAVDMLGVRRPFKEVTLAHIIPDCYADLGQQGDLALPADSTTNPRCFLLLPEVVHTWFDNDVVGFLPKSDGITLRVLNPSHTAPLRQPPAWTALRCTFQRGRRTGTGR